MPAEVQQCALTLLALSEERLDGVQHFRTCRVRHHRAVVVLADLCALQNGLHVVQIGTDRRKVVIVLAVVRGGADQEGVPIVVSHSRSVRRGGVVLARRAVSRAPVWWQGSLGQEPFEACVFLTRFAACDA